HRRRRPLPLSTIARAFHEPCSPGSSRGDKEDPMASIRKEIVIEASPKHVWDAVRDVGAVHERLAPGFVVDTRLEAGARVVTFANGLVARELIVDVDDEARRLAWAVVGSPRLTLQHVSMQVFGDGHAGSR